MLVELIEFYRAETLSRIIDKDKDREIEVGMVRGYEKILRAIVKGPVSIEQFTKQ